MQATQKSYANNDHKAIPLLDSSGNPKKYKYKLKRSLVNETVELNGKDVNFKYTTVIKKSYGRV